MDENFLTDSYRVHQNTRFFLRSKATELPDKEEVALTTVKKWIFRRSIYFFDHRIELSAIVQSRCLTGKK
jgi:hypothetical protein